MEPAPGFPGTVLRSHKVVGLDAGGRPLVYAQISDSLGYGLWRGFPDRPELVAAVGGAAPGSTSGLRFVAFKAASMAGSGAVAFSVDLEGVGTDISNRRALWVMQRGEPELIARAGDPVYGVPDATWSYGSFESIETNAEGQILVLAMDEVAGQRRQALYFWHPGYGFVRIARVGDSITFARGDKRVLRSAAINYTALTDLVAYNRVSHSNQALASGGRLGFLAGFEDGASAVIFATVEDLPPIPSDDAGADGSADAGASPGRDGGCGCAAGGDLDAGSSEFVLAGLIALSHLRRRRGPCCGGDNSHRTLPTLRQSWEKSWRQSS